MTAIFLQVRLNSTRLPGKALLPLPGGTVIQHAMRALRRIPVDVYALVTDAASTPQLTPYAAAEGFVIFTGPAENVLQRYCLAAEHYQVQCVIRATGDNPLVSPLLGAEILRLHQQEAADLSHFLGMPLGTGVEVVQAEALRKAAAGTEDPFEQEHLTTFLYRHREQFHVIEPDCQPLFYLPETKISLDTEADYQLILRVYRDLYRGIPIETDQLVQWFKSRRNEEFARTPDHDKTDSVHSRE